MTLARIWRGITLAANADPYLQYLEECVAPAYRAAGGSAGFFVMKECQGELVHFLLPLSRRWAREYYGLRGAYFPHSAYPVEMSIMPYPVPTWGWEICETPWTVQSLWWHYLYTQDKGFLEHRAFLPMEAE